MGTKNLTFTILTNDLKCRYRNCKKNNQKMSMTGNKEKLLYQLVTVVEMKIIKLHTRIQQILEIEKKRKTIFRVFQSTNYRNCTVEDLNMASVNESLRGKLDLYIQHSRLRLLTAPTVSLQWFNTLLTNSLVSWSGKISRLHPCRGVRPLQRVPWIWY